MQADLFQQGGSLAEAGLDGLKAVAEKRGNREDHPRHR